ncbi:MAG: hypothetical protein FJX52_02715 [Alphaproteobacteria bacterium]|nr:hypothetical protein [Alphaproteobacteria bacterium]
MRSAAPAVATRRAASWPNGWRHGRGSAICGVSSPLSERRRDAAGFAQSDYRCDGAARRQCRGCAHAHRGHRDRARPGLRRRRRCARRRAGHSRNRSAGADLPGRSRRCHRLERRVGFRPWRGRWRGSVAAPAVPRLSHPRRAGADRAGRHPVRSGQWRRQGLGRALTLSGARPASDGVRRSKVFAGQCRGGVWRGRRPAQGRAGQRLVPDRRWHRDRRDRCGQFLWRDHDAGFRQLLGLVSRTRRRGGRAKAAGPGAADGSGAGMQGAAQRARHDRRGGVQHYDRRGRDQDGMARAIRPVHTPFDGDTVFCLSTGARPLAGPAELVRIGALAADCLARAVMRGVYAADSLGAMPGYRSVHGMT